MTAPSLVEEAMAAAFCITWDRPESQVRAIIAVVLRRMEEPSDGMINAAVHDYVINDHAMSYKGQWCAMLAAFRKENDL